MVKEYSQLNDDYVSCSWPVNVLYTTRLYIIQLSQYQKFMLSLPCLLLTSYEKQYADY
jgi:hypothetical protein